MSKFAASTSCAFTNVVCHSGEYSASGTFPIAPRCYAIAEEVYLLLQQNHFEQVFRQLAHAQEQLTAWSRGECAKVDTLIELEPPLESGPDFASEVNNRAILEVDFDGLRSFLGVGNKLKQPLEWAEVNFIRVFLMHPRDYHLCFDAFGLLAEQYYFFNRQDLADKLASAYLEALRLAVVIENKN